MKKTLVVLFAALILVLFNSVGFAECPALTPASLWNTVLSGGSGDVFLLDNENVLPAPPLIGPAGHPFNVLSFGEPDAHGNFEGSIRNALFPGDLPEGLRMFLPVDGTIRQAGPSSLSVRFSFVEGDTTFDYSGAISFLGSTCPGSRGPLFAGTYTATAIVPAPSRHGRPRVLKAGPFPFSGVIVFDSSPDPSI